MKTHLKATGLLGHASVCGRGKRVREDVRLVDCRLCMSTPAYVKAKAEADAAKLAAFNAQTPRQMQEPWSNRGTIMVCRECGTDQFRMGDRTCMGHYQSYVCVNGHTESRLTETGMSF